MEFPFDNLYNFKILQFIPIQNSAIILYSFSHKKGDYLWKNAYSITTLWN